MKNRIRDGMAFSLKRAGFVVEQARNGEEALHLARPGAFDAVVSGVKWNLPLKPGPGIVSDSLLLTSRLSSVITGLPILHVLTPPAVGHPVEHPHLAQVFASIVKPFSPEHLVAALWRAIRGDDHLKAETWSDGLVLLTQDKVYSETSGTAGRRKPSHGHRSRAILRWGAAGKTHPPSRKPQGWPVGDGAMGRILLLMVSAIAISDPDGSFPRNLYGNDDAVSLLYRADGGTCCWTK